MSQDQSHTNKIKNILDKYDVEVWAPLPLMSNEILEMLDGEKLLCLKKFYEITNGIEADYFCILPLYDECNPKKTWDSLERANNFLTTKFNVPDADFLRRFLIFAEIGGLCVALLDREDGSIWYEDQTSYHQTDLSFEEFLDGMLSEVFEK
jgi:hypothetical protein